MQKQSRVLSFIDLARCLLTLSGSLLFSFSPGRDGARQPALLLPRRSQPAVHHVSHPRLPHPRPGSIPRAQGLRAAHVSDGEDVPSAAVEAAVPVCLPPSLPPSPPSLSNLPTDPTLCIISISFLIQPPPPHDPRPQYSSLSPARLDPNRSIKTQSRAQLVVCTLDRQNRLHTQPSHPAFPQLAAWSRPHHPPLRLGPVLPNQPQGRSVAPVPRAGKGSWHRGEAAGHRCDGNEPLWDAADVRDAIRVEGWEQSPVVGVKDRE